MTNNDLNIIPRMPIADGLQDIKEAILQQGGGGDNKLNSNNPIASGYFVLNKGTHSPEEFGDFSSTEGNGCLAEGIASHAEGVSTLSQGDASHTEGQSTKSEGRCTHAEGGNTIALGDFSHAEGNSTATNNLYEHAEGHFNKSHKASNTYGDAGNTIHSVGIGNNLQNRKNAYEIMQNGDAYLYNVGNYDGVNIEGARTLQDIIQTIISMFPEEYISSKEYTRGALCTHANAVYKNTSGESVTGEWNPDKWTQIKLEDIL